MAFPRAILLSALLAAATVKAAPLKRATTCKVDSGHYGSITINGAALSLGNDGKFVVGGQPQQFRAGVCQTHNEDPKGYTVDTIGYIVNAYDESQCLTASVLDQTGATFSFQDCKLDANHADATQSFAWTQDYVANFAKLYFNGESNSYINDTSHSAYNLRGEGGANTDLIVGYSPNKPQTIPETHFNLNYIPSSVALPPPIKCSSQKVGQILFNNQTAASNTYSGPINAKWEAQAGTTDKFVFEQCDYSSAGFTSNADVTYGRLRPGTDLSNGEYNCYQYTGDDGATGSDNTPSASPWINGLQVQECWNSADNAPGEQLVRLNNNDNSFAFVPFPADQPQPGNEYWYTQGDYVDEYGVTQYVWDSAGIGQVYLDSSNANLTKYPPGKVTFQAS
jgi:hypothetical protein